MGLSTELREALARSRRRPRPRELVTDRPLVADPDDVIDPDDSDPRLSVTLKDDAVGVVANIQNGNNCSYPELPPPLLVRQQRRQALLHRPIYSIPWYSVRCRHRSLLLCCTSRPIHLRGDDRRR